MSRTKEVTLLFDIDELREAVDLYGVSVIQTITENVRIELYTAMIDALQKEKTQCQIERLN